MFGVSDVVCRCYQQMKSDEFLAVGEAGMICV